MPETRLNSGHMAAGNFRRFHQNSLQVKGLGQRCPHHATHAQFSLNSVSGISKIKIKKLMQACEISKCIYTRQRKKGEKKTKKKQDPLTVGFSIFGAGSNFSAILSLQFCSQIIHQLCPKIHSSWSKSGVSNQS